MSTVLLNPRTTGGTGAGGFVLPSISANYLGWWEARLQTGFTDGAAVGTITDRSGAGNNWTQSTAGFKPVFKTGIVNSQAVFRFDGTDDYVSLASDILSGKTEAEIFIVLKIDNEPPAAGKDGLWNMDGDNGNAVNYSYNGDGNLYEAWASTARKSTGVNPTPALTSFRLYNIGSKSAEYKIRLDGTEIYTTGTNTFSTFNDGLAITLGKSDGGFGPAYFDGDIAAVVIVDAVLSSPNRELIEAELALAYALTIA